MLRMGDGDSSGALAEFEAALVEAQRIDPEGPRVAEVLSTMAIFHGQGGAQAEAEACQARAAKIFSKFEGLEP